MPHRDTSLAIKQAIYRFQMMVTIQCSKCHTRTQAQLSNKLYIDPVGRYIEWVYVIYYELLFFATNKHKYIRTVGVGATSVTRGVIGGKQPPPPRTLISLYRILISISMILIFWRFVHLILLNQLKQSNTDKFYQLYTCTL